MMLSRVFGKGSIYETLDLDDRREQDPGYELYDSELSHDNTDSRNEHYSLQDRGSHLSRHSRLQTANSVYRHYENTLPNLNEEDGNDEVPESLLVEDHVENQRPQKTYEPFNPSQEQAIIDNMERGLSPPRRGGSRTPDHTVWLGLVDPKERAMWKWANVENLDIFLQQVSLWNYFLFWLP
jgi:hypothetical protein